jgi:cytidine deaminase
MDEAALLVKAAREALTKAYAPYSRIRVGAAVMSGRGQMYSGGNIENASYGLSVCAERVAVFQAVAAEGGERLTIRAVAVVSDREGLFAPCGACRQVIAEFGPEALVIFQGPEGLVERPITELLPEGFRLA